MDPAPPSGWEELYQANDTPWDKGNPNPALLEALEGLVISGRVLVPGCGCGHDAAALAKAGAEVIGLDLAPTAISRARRLYASGTLLFEVGDLFQLPPKYHGGFEWVVEHTCFCAIDPSSRPDYVRAVAQALRSGGELLAIFYLEPHHAEPNHGPPFGVSLAELDRLFSAQFALLKDVRPTRAFPGREGREQCRRYGRK